MKKLIHLSVFVLVLFYANTSIAQQRYKYLGYIFPSDSLRGFNEVTAGQEALQRGFFGLEYKVFMYSAKRNFINTKYGYAPKPTMDQASNSALANAKGYNPVINVAPCNNEDFEASPVGNAFSVAGWVLSTGQNNGTNGSCTLAGCCPGSVSTSSDFWIVATPAADPLIGTIPNSPLGGSKVIKMNDNVINQGEIVRISQTFPVTSANALFQFAYMAGMDGSGHACCDNPFLKISLLNCANAPLACPSISITAPGPSCATAPSAGWTSNSSGISYTPAWMVSSIDLTPYLGSCVTIQVTVGDCDGWGHYGFAYFDASCAPMTIMVNNVPFPVGTNAANVSACASTATMTAPPGLNPYNWTGPAGSGITNNPNQTVTTTVGGNYTLTVNPIGSCAPITRTVNLTFVAPPNAGFTNSNVCATFTFNNTGTAAPAVQTYSFAGPSAVTSYTTTNPSSSVTFPTPGTYTVYQTITSGSCTATSSAVVVAPAGPNAAFTTPTYTQCITGNSFIFTAATGSGTHTYSFSPAAGAPAPGNTANYGPVSFTAPGTYTVTHTINTGGCFGTTNSVVVINPPPVPVANNNGPLCTGSTLSLTAGGGTSYSWSGPGGFSSGLQNPTVPSVAVANGGIYTVTVTANGCTAVTTTSVTVTTPTASANNTGPYCPGATITLTTASAASYTWTGPGAYNNNSQNPNIPNCTPAMAGIYTVSASFGSCIASATTNVVVLPSPDPSFSTPTYTQCINGNSFAFTAADGTGTHTYSFSPAAGAPASGNIANYGPVSFTAPGTYTVTHTISSGAGCPGLTTSVVVVEPMPTPVANNNGPLCVGSPLSLTSSGGTTYQWSGPNSFASGLQNPSIASVGIADAGVYTVTVNLGSCTDVATTTLVVTTPTAAALNGGPYCAGTSISLMVGAASSYTWTGPPAFNSNTQNPVIPNSTTAMSGVYTVSVSYGTCIAVATTTVTINPAPNPGINTNSPICVGEDIIFTPIGAGTYSWAGPLGFTSAAANPTITGALIANSGNYSLTVTDANSCVATAVANVTVNPQPNVSATGTNVCENSNATMISNGGVNYQWSGPNGFTSSSQNPIIVGVSPLAVGQYTVLVTDANSCTNTAVANLGINPAPQPTINSNSPVCLNEDLSFFTGGGVTYSWTGPNGFFSTLQNPSFNANTTAYSGNYSVTVTDASGCFATVGITASVNPLPVANVTRATNQGCAPLCTTFTVQSNPAAADVNWVLGNGAYSNHVNPAEGCYTSSGIYTVTALVTDANGCVTEATQTVEVYPQPVADFNHAPIKPIINIDADVKFTDASYGANIVSWNWYFMNTPQYQSSMQNPTFIYQDPGTYVVALVVKSDKGCLDTLIRPLEVGEDFGIYVPNTFTPNGDGLNDIFQPKGFGIVKYNMMIFDRWGEKIFESNEFEKGWDGKVQKKSDVNYATCPEGVYTWKIQVTSVFSKSHQYTGHVTLIK